MKVLKNNSQIRGIKKVKPHKSEYSESSQNLNKSDNAINPMHSNNTMTYINEANMRIRESPIKIRHFSLKKVSAAHTQGAEDMNQSKDHNQVTNTSSFLYDRYEGLNLTDGQNSKTLLYDDNEEEDDGSCSRPINISGSHARNRFFGRGGGINAFSRLEKQYQNITRLSGVNLNNLSKSIIIHHSKNQSLLQTYGRYNEEHLHKIEEDEYADNNDQAIKIEQQNPMDDKEVLQQNRMDMHNILEEEEGLPEGAY